MTSPFSPETSGAVAGTVEPLHSFVYFTPDAARRYTALGLEPGPMCYFGPRAAALGPVGAGPVAALFYNFNPELVARFVPDAWDRVPPADLLSARLAVADTTLRRILGDDVVASAEVAEAAGLARTAAEAAPLHGRPMAAALRDLDWPAAPHLVLWHAASILREHRGDGHVAVLAVEGLSGVEALMTFTATGAGFLPSVARTARGWSDDRWAACAASLRERGLLDGSGDLTAGGWALRRRIEAETDRLGHAPWAALGAEGAARLGGIAGRLVRALLDGGAFPEDTFGPESPRNPSRAR